MNGDIKETSSGYCDEYGISHDSNKIYSFDFASGSGTSAGKGYGMGDGSGCDGDDDDGSCSFDGTGDA